MRILLEEVVPLDAIFIFRDGNFYRFWLGYNVAFVVFNVITKINFFRSYCEFFKIFYLTNFLKETSRDSDKNV